MQGSAKKPQQLLVKSILKDQCVEFSAISWWGCELQPTKYLFLVGESTHVSGYVYNNNIMSVFIILIKTDIVFWLTLESRICWKFEVFWDKSTF